MKINANKKREPNTPKSDNGRKGTLAILDRMTKKEFNGKSKYDQAILLASAHQQKGNLKKSENHALKARKIALTTGKKNIADKIIELYVTPSEDAFFELQIGA